MKERYRPFVETKDVCIYQKGDKGKYFEYIGDRGKYQLRDRKSSVEQTEGRTEERVG